MTAPRRVPRLLALPPGKTLQSFPLGPIEGFVLSRIDGSTSESDIVAMTGLEAITVTATLEKLASFGIVSFGSQPPTPAAPVSAPQITQPTMPPRPVRDTPSMAPLDVRTEAPAPPRGLYDPTELDEDIDLDMDHRRRVLDLFHRLDELDHYEILSVPQSADKKAIKRAYYEAAGVFHPDKFFRKRLGTFKMKMEQVFSRITLAHDTLTNKDSRAEYDEYLGDRKAAEAIEADLQKPVSTPAIRESIPPLQPLRVSSTPPVTISEPPAGTAPPPPPSSPTTTSSAPPRVSEQARREALARRLMGARSSAQPRTQSASLPAVSADPEALRRHYKARVDAMRERVVKEHVDVANAAMTAGDWSAALSAFKQALTAAPNDNALRDSLVEAQRRATEQLAENYRRQARYEEKGQHWAEAARSWKRVATALPNDAPAHERAAYTALKADGNLHEASALAQKAITLDSTQPSYRVTLAEVYLAAGLHLNARRELEAALLLVPGDTNIQTLLKRIKG